MKSSLDLAITFLILLGLIALLLTSEVFAEDFTPRRGPLGFGFQELHEPMQADRPYVTARTTTIQRGHVQGESGYQYSNESSDRTNQSIPEVLLRAGVSDITELRLSFIGYQQRSIGDDTDYGISDLTLGAKIKTFEACDCNFSVSLLGEVTLPTGASSLSQEEVSGNGALLMEYGIQEDLTLGSNLRLDVPVADEDYFIRPAASFNLLYELNEYYSLYSEYFGLYPSGYHAPEENPSHYLNGGIAWQTERNLRFDVFSGFGLNSTADDLIAGIGLTFRL